MASLFAAFERVASGVQSALYGEEWILHARTRAADGDVNAAQQADATRTGIVIAVHRDAPKEGDVMHGYDSRSTNRPGIMTSDPMIEIDPRHQPPGEPVIVRDGDILERRSDGSRWRLNRGIADGMGRVQYSANVM